MSNTNTAELKRALESKTDFYHYSNVIDPEELRQSIISLLAEQNQEPDRVKVAEKFMVGLCANSIPGRHNMPDQMVEQAFAYADEFIKQSKQ